MATSLHLVFVSISSYSIAVMSCFCLNISLFYCHHIFLLPLNLAILFPSHVAVLSTCCYTILPHIVLLRVTQTDGNRPRAVTAASVRHRSHAGGHAHATPRTQMHCASGAMPTCYACVLCKYTTCYALAHTTAHTLVSYAGGALLACYAHVLCK